MNRFSYDARLPAPINEPPRLPLARIPTPLEPLKRSSEDLGIDLWIKRDDLSGSILSGNKVRKLEYLAAEAKQRASSLLVTCGGVNSNHARTVCAAAKRLGWKVKLLLRGSEHHPIQGNLLLNRWLGADITYISKDEYAHRDTHMARLAGSTGYVIPEGGSNGLGAVGYIRCAYELVHQAQELGLDLRRVVLACSSGGTTAGLALGFAALHADVEIINVAVSDHADYLDARIKDILEDTAARGIAEPSLVNQARWFSLDGFVGKGYALTTPEELQLFQQFASREGIIVDPVYTGKALLPLLKHTLPTIAGSTVFIHTGGIFELFQYTDHMAFIN
ncbi:MAG: D-cysteine desulfhydrase family protein [Myxococcales bacterium]|nr:D-cysteine desulfhydrase family protein [Myxococcales bacterium]